MKLVSLLLAVNSLFILSCSIIPYQAVKKEKGLQTPKGWYHPKINPKIRYISAHEDKTGYHLLIDRSNDEKNMAFLHLTESIYPSREKLKLSHSSSREPKLKNWYFERVWWNEEFKGFKIPFSITTDTLNYYIKQYARIKSEIKTKRDIQPWKGGNQQRVFFEYSGKVKRASGSNSQVIVVLTIKWYLFCGQQCGWGFEKQRTILFDSKERVNAVTGDGPTEKWVSSAKTPFAPNQWITF